MGYIRKRQPQDGQEGHAASMAGALHPDYPVTSDTPEDPRPTEYHHYGPEDGELSSYQRSPI